MPPEPMTVAAAHSRPEMPRLSCFRTCSRSRSTSLCAAPLAGQVQLGEPHGAEGQREGQLDQAVHRADQLQAAAADVGHEGALAGQPEVVRHRAVGERRLGLGVDDAERDVQLLRAPAGRTRRRSPPRARRRWPPRRSACTPRRWQTSRMRARVCMARSIAALVEAAGRGEPGREAGLVLQLVDDGEAGGGIVLGDEQADGVGADVDGGDALAGGRRAPGLDAGRALTCPRWPGRRRTRAPRPGPRRGA